MRKIEEGEEEPERVVTVGHPPPPVAVQMSALCRFVLFGKIVCILEQFSLLFCLYNKFLCSEYSVDCFFLSFLASLVFEARKQTKKFDRICRKSRGKREKEKNEFLIHVKINQEH